MTVSGIFESLIGTAIWAIFVYITNKIRMSFREENEKYQGVFEQLKHVIYHNDDPALKVDLYLALNSISNSLQQRLNDLYQGRIISVILFIFFAYVALTKQSGNDGLIAGNDGLIIIILYSFLLWFESFEIRKIKGRLHEINSSVMGAVRDRAEKLPKESTQE